MNAERKMLEAIRRELQTLGFGADEPVSGCVAVEYLGSLYKALSDYLEAPSCAK